MITVKSTSRTLTTATGTTAGGSTPTVTGTKATGTMSTGTKATGTNTSTKATGTGTKATGTKATGTMSTGTKATGAMYTSTTASGTTATGAMYTDTTAAGTTATSTTAAGTTTSGSTPTSTGTSGRTRFGGVNIAGFDFGCSTDGSCDLSSTYGPVANMPPHYNNPDGAAQMQHFYNNDGLNMFRLPVGWQYLVNNQLGGTLDSTNLGYYDQLVQSCLGAGSDVHCIIDIHNYARWNGGIIGQGGPSNAQFASLWTQLATKYASESRVAFAIVNEPHDIPSISTWADTVQEVVTAIRGAGATSQYIFMPGTDWQSASSFLTDGSADALLKVVDADGTTDKLIFDLHKYLDSDGSGSQAECVTNNIDAAFAPVANWLRQKGRMAVITETGGGSVSSCQKYFCEAIDYLDQNADVYLGYTGWAAGSFDTLYVLSMRPNGSQDALLVSSCLKRT